MFRRSSLRVKIVASVLLVLFHTNGFKYTMCHAFLSKRNISPSTFRLIKSWDIPTVKRPRLGRSEAITTASCRSSPFVSSTLNMVAASFSSSVELPQTSPLASTTLAGMIERGIIERFGEESAARVLQSWRLLDAGYEHREYVGTDPTKTPQNSNCHQHAPSYLPGLTPIPFWNIDDLEWPQKLASQYEAIREEFLRVAVTDPKKLEQEGNNIWAGALTEDASSYGAGWRTLVLLDRGLWDETNVRLFPATAKAVRDSGVPAVEVFFACMKANTDIKPHSDFTNFVLTSHLAVDIPYSGENKCRITVGDETREWINGQVMLFDTSIMHDAINESDKDRYILMLRLWHPDLTEVERKALQFIWDCLAVPEIVTSSDPGERFMSEQRLALMKEFPKLPTQRGFGGNGSKPNKGKKQKRGRKGGGGGGFGSK